MVRRSRTSELGRNVKGRRPRRLATLVALLSLTVGACGGGGEQAQEESTPQESPAPEASTRSIWVVNTDAENVYRLDAESHELVAVIDLNAYFPASIAAGAGAIWVGNSGEDTVTRIDPATNEISAQIDPGVVEDVAFAEDALWVSQQEENSVAKIDPATNDVAEVVELPDENWAGEILFAEGSLWVGPAYGEGDIHRVDVESGEVVASITVDSTVWDFAYGEGFVWAVSVGTDKIYKIDPATNELVDEIEPEERPWRIAVGHGSLWVASIGRLSKMDPTTGEFSTVFADISTEIGDPEVVEVSEDAVWVAAGDQIFRVDPESVQVTDTIDLQGLQAGPAAGPTPSPGAAVQALGPQALLFD